MKTQAETRIDETAAELPAKIDGAQDQWNAGARIADDCFCRSCGKRGVVGICRTCEGSGR